MEREELNQGLEMNERDSRQTEVIDRHGCEEEWKVEGLG